MNKLGLAPILGTLLLSTILGALPACLGDAPIEEANGATTDAESALVGRWQFVYDDVVRARVEADLAREVAAADRPGAASAAREEAESSFIELTEDGEIFSWVGGELHMQGHYRAEAAGPGALRLAMVGEEQGPGPVKVTLRGDDVMVIDDPRKGPLTFRRVR